MNWNDLSILLEVSRAKTMSEAARRLGVNQTTVSRRLDALETTLGVTLVMRRRDGIGLTEEGGEAARAAEVMQTVAHDLERKLVGADAELAGRVRVATHPMLTLYHPDLFTGFSDRYPSVALEVEAGTDPRSLARREADVSIRWTLQPDEGLFGRKLVRAEYALYAAKKLQRSIGPRARLTSYPWLAFTERSRARLIDAWMRTHVPSAKVICRYEDSVSMHAAIRAGRGVGFMPCAYADTDSALVRLRGVEPDFGFDIWGLTHTDLSRTGRVRAFLAHAAGYFDSRKELYAGKRPRRRAR